MCPVSLPSLRRAVQGFCRKLRRRFRFGYSCGVRADNFLTQDVIDLALAKAANAFMPELEKLLKKELGEVGNDFISFDVKMEHDEEPEIPIRQAIEALQKVTCKDCKRVSKVSSALAMSSYACPYCGIGQFNGF